MSLAHPVAKYIDDDQKIKTIHAADLEKPDMLALARRKTLLDETMQIVVHPVTGDRTPHFRAAVEITQKFYRSGDIDPAHNLRIDRLLRRLKSNQNTQLILRDKDKIFSSTTLGQYIWGNETTRYLTEKVIVRHDIFGQSNELSMSKLRPWIAIEVINTHYPEEDAFEAMLQTSRRMPYIIFFDFTAFPNAFLKVSEDGNNIEYKPWTYYIKDGLLWKGERNIEATSQYLRANFELTTRGWNRN